MASPVAESAAAGAGSTSAGSAEPLAGGSCPAAFPIKGNVNEAGERIAHSPGQQFYEKTDAEECFADLAAAAAGGFRASTR
jgi:hypothetical protein